MRASFLLIVALLLSACGAARQQAVSSSAPSQAAATTAPTTPAASPTIAPATPTLVPTLPPAAPPAAPPSAAPAPTATASAVPTAPASAPATDTGDLIFYLDNDGRTIATIRPDGSDRQIVTVISKQPQQSVIDMTANYTGAYLIYRLSDDTTLPRSFLVSGGVATLLPNVVERADWYGNRFVTGVDNGSATTSSLSIFDLGSGSPVEQRLNVDGSVPTWSADGSRIIYVDAEGNIASIDALAGAQPTTLLYLNPPEIADAEPGSEEWSQGWDVSWVALAEDGITLVFAGAQRGERGASGNGERIWSFQGIPGSTGVQPLTDAPTRYSDSDHDFLAPDTIVAGSDGHNSACAVDPLIEVVAFEAGGGQPIDLPLGDAPYSFVHDVSAPPYRADRAPRFAFSIAPYNCADNGPIDQAPPALYVWLSPAAANSPQITEIADGRFPVWIDTGMEP